MTNEKTAALTIEIDRGKCIGAGNCVDVAPGVFAQELDTGVVVLLDRAVSDDSLSTVGEAADLCPSRAIALVPAGRDTAPG